MKSKQDSALNVNKYNFLMEVFISLNQLLKIYIQYFKANQVQNLGSLKTNLFLKANAKLLNKEFFCFFLQIKHNSFSEMPKTSLILFSV